MGSNPEEWERATWAGARNAVLQEGARMTLRQKLAWLESAHLLAERLLEAARLRRNLPSDTPAAKGVG